MLRIYVSDLQGRQSSRRGKGQYCTLSLFPIRIARHRARRGGSYLAHTSVQRHSYVWLSPCPLNCVSEEQLVADFDSQKEEPEWYLDLLSSKGYHPLLLQQVCEQNGVLPPQFLQAMVRVF